MVGTCKMGAHTDGDAVVDPQLRVKGIAGLRVIDSSICPTIPSSNTNIPSIAIGEKGADMVKPDELVQVLPSPDVINIVVCGDPDRNRAMVLWGGYVSPVTKKIEIVSAGL